MKIFRRNVNCEVYNSQTFTEQFLEARMVSTPLVVVRTHDPLATVRTLADSFGEKKDATPFISWDAINGLKGLTTCASEALAAMLQPSGTEIAETVDLPTALGVLASADENVIAFIHCPDIGIRIFLARQG